MAHNKILQTGIVPDNITEKEAIAIVNGAWANCFAGRGMPEKFSEAISELGRQFTSVAAINLTITERKAV